MLPPPFISIMSRAYSQLPPAGSSSARRYRQKNAYMRFSRSQHPLILQQHQILFRHAVYYIKKGSELKQQHGFYAAVK
jgi:hypothetical protein